MQLGASTRPGPAAEDVAKALRDGAARLGHRPAVTQLLPTGRQEQSVASLAQWAAKGAHLLDLELGLRPGDRIGLDAAPGWPTATVVLAAWWAGIGVQLVGDPGRSDSDDPEVCVIHETRATGALPQGREIFWLGDGIDGAPVGLTSGLKGEPWTHAVQSFPDQPPVPGAAADAEGVVVRTDDAEDITSQQTLLRMAADFDADGPIGIDVDEPRTTTLDLALVCLRPLVTGRATVVVRGVPRSAADGDRVAAWR